jgi:hypothetical protein|tara:strand:- start:3190 stop:3756 length:567 start_codon:yes stop_codon:yes gene_type:complete
MPPIKINVTPDAKSAKELAEIEEPQDPQISLIARKTLDGQIMIMDHRDIDIIIDTGNKKIITFPKDEMSDEVYQTQDKYFHHLANEGVIDRSSVHSGNIFASIQAKYPEALDEGVSAAQIILLSTYKFIEEERPRFELEEWYENELEDWYAHPTDEDSTELGEVPEEPEKGSLAPYGVRRYLGTGPYE